MSYIQPPKSDLGTIFVHWVTVAALLSAVITGLAIAAGDNPWLWAVRYFGFLLPGENIWIWHLYFGITLLSSILAYAVYVRRTQLAGRIAFNASRFSALLRGGRFGWASLNVLLYWVLFLAFALETCTGVLLFFNFGGVFLKVHLHTTWLFLVFLFLHPFVHWLYGGKGQITRIFKPQWRLPQRQPELVDALIERVQALEIERTSPAPDNSLAGSRTAEPPKTVTIFAPLALAIAAGAALAPLCTAIEEQTQQTLGIVRIDAADAPSIDGDISEAVWRRAPAAVALTQHGANFGGGESTVEVRAVHDGKFAYFAFTWTDPSRSLRHMPLVKGEDGWHLMRSDTPGNETQFHEDKFAVLLAAGGQHLLGKGFHFGQHPVSDAPAGATGRGLHYLAGGYGDIWQWRASHGGMSGWIDHGHFGPPLPGSAPQPSGRYAGGFTVDPLRLPYQDNFTAVSSPGAYPRVRPLRFPKNAAAFLKLSSLSLDPDNSDAESSRFWLSPDESLPYSEVIDRALPAGTVIPSILFSPELAKGEDPASVIGNARWTSGRWSLELKRRLDTGGLNDTVIKSGALMWVAAFDHAETWHNYHLRPFELELE
ncbi:MAG: cytochrome b/b6 domain-containing protein [Bradyrhizobiaceae bacterium]|nr:cytochrome b/b6 domain-containing protein [Bradyrhizobiaceae bacterium]